MSKASNIDDDENITIGPDYFSFYVREVGELFSEDDVVPSGSQTSEPFERKLGDFKGKDANMKIHDPLFSCSMKLGSKRERLKALLREGVVVLSQEVDEMLDPVVSIPRLRSTLKTRNCLTLEDKISDGDGGQSHKKLKVSSSVTSTTLSPDGSPLVGDSKVEVNDDLQILLENDSSEVEETISKYSNELSETLKHMEQQLEELLDSVMSKCRPMSLKEKQELQKVIRNLHPENLARIVEILQHHKLEKESISEEIYVDLDKEDDATLWRLYYYTEAVEKAKKLAKLVV